MLSDLLSHSAGQLQGWDWIPSPCDSKARGSPNPSPEEEKPVLPTSLFCLGCHSSALQLTSAINHQETKGTAEFQDCGSVFSPVNEWPSPHFTILLCTYVPPEQNSRTGMSHSVPCPVQKATMLSDYLLPFPECIQGSTTQPSHSLLEQRALGAQIGPAADRMQTSKILNLSRLQFPHLQNGGNNSTCLEL